jgi:hypothetical protein
MSTAVIISVAVSLILAVILIYVLYTYWDQITGATKQTFITEPNEYNKFKQYDYTNPKDMAYVLNH